MWTRPSGKAPAPHNDFNVGKCDSSDSEFNEKRRERSPQRQKPKQRKRARQRRLQKTPPRRRLKRLPHPKHDRGDEDDPKATPPAPQQTACAGDDDDEKETTRQPHPANRDVGDDGVKAMSPYPPLRQEQWIGDHAWRGFAHEERDSVRPTPTLKPPPKHLLLSPSHLGAGDDGAPKVRKAQPQRANHVDNADGDDAKQMITLPAAQVHKPTFQPLKIPDIHPTGTLPGLRYQYTPRNA